VPDIFLYSGETNPSDVRLRDPTVSAATIYTLIAETVAFIETGIAARLTARLVGGVGAYVDTGKTAALRNALSGGIGAYSETGRSAPLQTVLRPIRATYILTGYAASGGSHIVGTFLNDGGLIVNIGRLMNRRS
jgi:hypothetical protein